MLKSRGRRPYAPRLHSPEQDAPLNQPVRAADLVDIDDPAYRFILQVARELIELDFDTTDPEIAARAVRLGQQRHEAHLATEHERQERRRREAERRASLPSPVIYYMRIGNRVKIGWTSDIESRLKAINPEQLMVTEPGLIQDETRRHRQFAALRTHGEWFQLEPPLVEHIADLQDKASEGSA